MAISRQRKEEIVEQYVDWFDRSRAMILTEYIGLTVKDMDSLRAKTREVGGEFHIVKNTLTKVAIDRTGMSIPDGVLETTTAVFFAFQDAPALAKVVSEYSRESDFLKVKGGYLDKNFVDETTIKALADLPPLPVLRGQLLGLLMAPANKLVRTLVEPARQIAAVLHAYGEKDSSQAAA